MPPSGNPIPALMAAAAKTAEQASNAQYMPFYKIGEWITKTERKRMASGFVVFPSGIEEYYVGIAEDRRAVQVDITWPKLVCNVDIMFHKFYNLAAADGGFTNYHQRVLAIEAELAKMRLRADKSVKTSTRLALTFEAEKDFTWEHNLTVNGVHMYLFDASCAVNKFATPKKVKPVEHITIPSNDIRDPSTPATESTAGN